MCVYTVEYRKQKWRERERTSKWQDERSIDEEEGSQAAEALAKDVGDVLSAPLYMKGLSLVYKWERHQRKTQSRAFNVIPKSREKHPKES